MATLDPHFIRSTHYGPYRHAHVHFLAALLLVAVVLVATLMMRDYRAPQPNYDVPARSAAP